MQPVAGVEPGPELERELIAFCREHLAHYKCPRSIDFDDELPRLPTGKLYKRLLRDRYWKDRESRDPVDGPLASAAPSGSQTSEGTAMDSVTMLGPCGRADTARGRWCDAAAVECAVAPVRTGPSAMSSTTSRRGADVRP